MATGPFIVIGVVALLVVLADVMGATATVLLGTDDDVCVLSIEWSKLVLDDVKLVWFEVALLL